MGGEEGAEVPVELEEAEEGDGDGDCVDGGQLESCWLDIWA